MTGPLSLTFDRHQSAFARMAGTSNKDLFTLWHNEAKICLGGSDKMPGVAGITPPYAEGDLQDTRKAEAHAKAKVAADIYGLYGTPNDAYAAIKEKSPGQAGPFWWLLNHGDVPGASGILREATGSIIHPFDEGVYHRRNFRRRGQKGGFRFYVSDPKNLKAYVQLEQEQVWWLASGWRKGLEDLGARMPAGIKKHQAPGHLLSPIINDQQIVIAISNDVRFAGSIGDMQRRIQTVMDVYRVARLDRAWEKFLETLASGNGLAFRR